MCINCFCYFHCPLPSTIHSYQAVLKELLLKPELDYTMPKLKSSQSLASEKTQTLAVASSEA